MEKRVALLLLFTLAFCGLAVGGEIHVAARDGNLAKVKALLREDPALVSSREEEYGATPLHMAAFTGHTDVAELLLAGKADVNARNAEGSTPLHAAAFNGRKEVAELLLANEASVNARNNAGWTPLHFSSGLIAHKDVAELLLAGKADVNARAVNERTPLHQAAFFGHKDLAELLLANRANINARDNIGLTPLHLAAAEGQRALAQSGHIQLSQASPPMLPSSGRRRRPPAR